MRFLWDDCDFNTFNLNKMNKRLGGFTTKPLVRESSFDYLSVSMPFVGFSSGVVAQQKAELSPHMEQVCFSSV